MPIITSGRSVNVPAAVPLGNTTSILAWQQLLSWERSEGPMPVDLQLDVRLPASVGGGFPEIFANNFCAGAYSAAGPDAWDDSADGCIALKIELGTGANPRTLYADCRGGRFALGSNSFVRVSVARWLAAGTTATLVQGGISPSDGSGEYLTYSAVIDGVAAAATAVINVPPGATWFDFYPAPAGSWSAVSMDSVNPWIARRYESTTAPLYNPPTSPLPLLGSNGLVFTNRGAAPSGVCAVFYVR